MITIAIDGFSSTGKSTLAKQLAAHLGYVFVDTGAMYRGVTLYAIQNNIIGVDFFDVDKLNLHLPNINLRFVFNKDLAYSELYLNNFNVESQIRSMDVSNYVSRIAEISQVRSKLVEQQQEMGKNKGIVMDGRDIGTVVFPDAELKIFMTASPEVRAQRRFAELHLNDQSITFESVFENVQQRD
jgi:cytidylate kinase